MKFIESFNNWLADGEPNAKLEKELAEIEEQITGERQYLDNVGRNSADRNARIREDSYSEGVGAVIRASEENLAALEVRRKEILEEIGK